MPSRRRLLAALSLLPLAPAARPARAQPAPWPTRAVRIVVPFAGGGTTDVTARVVGERLSQILGQPVVIDNRPGAGGNVGSEAAARAEPDGHTLLMGTIGTVSINQYLYGRLPFDPKGDFRNLVLVNEVANGVLVGANSPIRDFAGLVAAAKASPGRLNFGTPGNGTSGHLSGELLKHRAGIDLQHVPYRGSATVIPDLIGGRVEVAVDNLPPYLPHLREGRLRLLAVTSAERWFAVPDAPTVAESGVPGFEAVAWFGLHAPGRTPAPVLDRLDTALAEVMADPAVQAKLRDLGSRPVGGTPAQFDRYIEAENAKWREVVRISGARLE